jgi:hypothetical protein
MSGYSLFGAGDLVGGKFGSAGKIEIAKDATDFYGGKAVCGGEV